MININNISNDSFNNLIEDNKISSQNPQEIQGKSFSQMLKNAVDDVNTSQVNAYNAMEGIATGKVKNLQEAVQRINEADVTLKLALEVKNKAITSYKEIMKMTV